MTLYDTAQLWGLLEMVKKYRAALEADPGSYFILMSTRKMENDIDELLSQFEVADLY